MRLKKPLLALAALVLCDQAVLWTALGDGYLLGRRIAPFDPPVYWPAQEEALARIQAHLEGRGALGAFDFDAELGWATPPGGGEGDWVHDWSGARVADAPLPREKRAGVQRVAAFGCSFTAGTEVGPRDAWPAQLGRTDDALEVANLGQAGYGLDQAFLRWRRLGAAVRADEVWLGLLPDAVLRNLALYWPNVRHWTRTVAFKPRFRIGATEELELVPCPADSLERMGELLGDGQLFAAACAGDHFVARTPAAFGRVGSHPLHWSAVGRLALTLRDHGGRSAARRLADPDDEAFAVTIAIVLAMRDEVEASGARFRLLVLPDRPGLASFVEAGRGYWWRFAAALEERGVEVVDLAPALAAADGVDLWAPGGHYSAAGNRVVADALARLPR